MLIHEARSSSRLFRYRMAAGFTLLELMLVVMVFGILATIAYASYANQIIKAQRSVAKSALLDAATREAQFFFSNRAYTANLVTDLGYASVYVGKDGASLPDSTGAIYQLSAVINDVTACGSASCFQITAAPVAGSRQEGDSCGSFTITSTNVRSAAQSGCW